jgi:hypothetical protein
MFGCILLSFACSTFISYAYLTTSHIYKLINNPLNSIDHQITSTESVENKQYGVTIDVQLECTICQCKYVEHEQTIVLPCAHIFHKNCIETWTNEKRTCPVCRQ